MRVTHDFTPTQARDSHLSLHAAFVIFSHTLSSFTVDQRHACLRKCPSRGQSPSASMCDTEHHKSPTQPSSDGGAGGPLQAAILAAPPQRGQPPCAPAFLFCPPPLLWPARLSAPSLDTSLHADPLARPRCCPPRACAALLP